MMLLVLFVGVALILAGLAIWVLRDELRATPEAPPSELPGWLARGKGGITSLRRRVEAWRGLNPLEQRWLDDTMEWLAEMRDEDDQAVDPKARAAQRETPTFHDIVVATDGKALVDA